MSSVSGMTATIRGAPSTPLKTRVADTKAFRFLICDCFALLRLLSLVCANPLEEINAFGDVLGTRPIPSQVRVPLEEYEG